MKLIVGLGNPGEKYLKNRHNVGSMFVDYLASHSIVPSDGGERGEGLFKFDKYMQAEITVLSDFIFAKPQTFMNKSGIAVKQIVARYGLRVAGDLFVAHDDLDIPLGKFKIQIGTGPKLHNGLDSIDNSLGTKEYYRIRIGVENRGERKIPGETYVLQNFMEDEKELLQNTFKEIEERLKLTLKEV